ncbi:hypothetical protein FRAHR75_320021 [Frankia sp. Hr75.2]|nr:hypothetical protein FRAHR75_320021 [Frankia sp. Hr75.2]SQD98837.1 hypothetical protein FMEAI12_4930015 [Parafrankia sp. Ea1.12]
MFHNRAVPSPPRMVVVGPRAARRRARMLHDKHFVRWITHMPW